MTEDVIRLNGANDDGRFSRFELIGWWDQEKLRSAKVVVVGAGAIGNELVKNLALLGIGNLFIADLDRIENSNLSRSVLFREADCGRLKADIAAERARDIFPDMKTQAFNGNVVYDLGLGLYRWADVILGGLDNREARVAINQSAARTGKVWIDGAIERLEGFARVFNPATGPCYECTMSEVDWKMLEARRSCALLTRDEMSGGKVPTTPTTASVIAGIQAQEAVKLIHGLETLEGKGFVFDGTWHQSYITTYTRLDDCPAHDKYTPIEVLNLKASTTRAGDLLEHVRRVVGPQAVIEANHDLLQSLTCLKCGTTEPKLSSLGKVKESDGRCGQCGEHRVPNVYHTIGDHAELLDHTLLELGIPPWDILSGRSGMKQSFFELGGDREGVLGALSH